jgi:hypothetical protein
MDSCSIELPFSPNRLPNETNNDRLERVFKEFDVLINNLLAIKADGKKIVIPNYGVPNINRAFFDHIIQYNFATGRFNNARLMACCFLPLVFEHCYVSLCQSLHNRVSHNNVKRKTLYCEGKRCAIIFIERANSIILVTIYHISKKEEHKYLRTKKDIP